MPEARHGARFAVTQLGCVAHDVLCRGGEGQVAAVFDQSFYVEIGDAMACIGNRNLEMGPLNAVTSAPCETSWLACGLRIGNPVVLSGDGMCVGERLVLALEGIRHWRPTPVPRNWNAATLRGGLDRLDRLAAGRVPENGLGRLIFATAADAADTPLLCGAREPVSDVRVWLELAGRDADPGEIERLLGLGPGLTPSGDDFLGGVMIALHALDERRALARLAARVRRTMAERTTTISIAHLSAAMDGMGSEAVHELLGCVLSGDNARLGDALARLGRIGHTSGWDCLAGIVVVLRARAGLGRPLAILSLSEKTVTIGQ